MEKSMTDLVTENKTFVNLAHSIYGAKWVQELAAETGYTEQTITGWRRGDRLPPPVVIRLLELKARNPADLRRVAADLAAMAEALAAVAARLSRIK